MASTSKAAAAAHSDDESTIKVATTKKPPKDKDRLSGGTVKLKRPAPKHNKPGNWRDGSVDDNDKKKGAGINTPSTNSVPASPGPVVNQLDEAARETFPTGRPLEDSVDLMKCGICKKMVLKSAAGTHLIACNKHKREKAQRKKEAKEAREKEKRLAEGKDDDEDDDEESPVKGMAGKKSAGKKIEGSGGKKRKADGEGEKSVKKKLKKEEVKVKVPKQKGPVDVEKQCGVMKDGVPCARSLTCKSHSMGAKRGVAGRSLPYDMLLAAYQKKNQAKQQKAALDATAPLEDEDAALGPIDSDEELTAVMHGLSNWNPQPVVQPPVLIPIEKRYLRERLREQLQQATNGFSVNIFRVKGQAPAGGELDAEGDVDMNWGDRRQSAFGLGIQSGMGSSIQVGGARRQSTASQR